MQGALANTHICALLQLFSPYVRTRRNRTYVLVEKGMILFIQGGSNRHDKRMQKKNLKKFFFFSY